MTRRPLLSFALPAVATVTAVAGLALAAPAKSGAKKAPAKAAEAAPAPEAAKDDPADVLDVSKVPKLVVFTDGKNHYFVASKMKGDDTTFYYGDGKKFWKQRVYGSGGTYDEKEGWSDVSMSFWEPRVDSGWKGSFGWKDGKVSIQCDTRLTELKPLPPDDGKKMIDGAKFYKPLWKRMAHRIARDREGNYFYVDNLREPDNAKAFRIFYGKKGAMKQLAMTNIVADSEGEIYSTKAGDLKVVLDKGESTWTEKGKATKLVSLNPSDNHIMIYSDLGVYSGQNLGTPCDDL